MDVTHAAGEAAPNLRQGTIAATRVDAAQGIPADHRPGATSAGGNQDTTGDIAPLDDLPLEPAGLDILVAAAGLYSPEAEERLQEQARQLAAHLQEAQRALDAREAHLHAQLARVENEVRVSRLWLRTREDQLREREEELQQQARAIAERESEFAARGTAEEASLRQLRESLARRQEELARREADGEAEQRRLAEQAKRLESKERELEAERAAWERHRELDQQALAQRAAQQSLSEERLNGARAMWEERLAEERAGLAAERARLAEASERLSQQLAAAEEGAIAAPPVVAAAAHEAHRLAAWEQAICERSERLDAAERLLAAHEEEHRLAVDLFHETQRMVAEERAAEEALQARQAAEQRRELEARREALDRQQQALGARQTTLEELHADISRLHREALEMRLISEELWAKLSGRAPPAELTRAVAETRSRLGEHYRLSERGLAARQQELAALADRLEAQQRKLADQRRDVQTWAAAHQAELERQAARLAAREAQVAAQQQALRSQELDWHEDRRRLQREIRHLHARLRTLEPASS